MMNVCGNAATSNQPELLNHQPDAIEECDHKYERMEKLGEGTYGVVYRSKDRETNEV